jgi:hypothetical protein
MSQQAEVIETYSPVYRGFKLFEIFEKRQDYLIDLGKFLQRKNKKLYAMFILRNEFKSPVEM